MTVDDYSSGLNVERHKQACSAGWLSESILSPLNPVYPGT